MKYVPALTLFLAASSLYAFSIDIELSKRCYDIALRARQLESIQRNGLCMGQLYIASQSAEAAAHALHKDRYDSGRYFVQQAIEDLSFVQTENCEKQTAIVTLYQDTKGLLRIIPLKG